MTESKVRARMKTLALLVVIMFSAITARLWFLQVLASDEFSRLAGQNQLRLVPIDPLRGLIVDREGRIFVGNRPSTVILVDRREMGDEAEQVLYRLSKLLDMPVEDLLDRLNSVRYLPFQPIPVAEDVSNQVAFYIEEHRDEFPGVDYGIEPLRSYPSGTLAAHLLGYLGEVSAEQLENPDFARYRAGELVGKAGIEAAYERYLHGTPGTRAIEVNAQGRVLDEDFSRRDAVPGNNVVLSIDQDVQRLAEESLTLGIRLARHTVDSNSGKPLVASGGAAIVMDPRTGQILGMASNPTYDPAIFNGGLSTSELTTLDLNADVTPSHNNPTLNRAIQGVYPAGSTFKPFVAAAALHEGILRPDTRLPCPPTWTVGNHLFHNWSPRNYGLLTIPEALSVSCDTFFYQVGYSFWQRYWRSGQRNELMQRDLAQMGFGRPTGIDIAGEQPGIIPTAEYERGVYESNPDVYGPFYGWLPGDAVNLSIGQGFLQVTPIQLAVAYSALANGGTLWEPHLAWRIATPGGDVVQEIAPEAEGRLPISTATCTYLRNAMTRVTEEGTAAGAFLGFPLDRIPVAGKTGTADILPKQPVSWFAAMAPANNPKYVVVTMVEQGGHGSTTAAPIARRILEGLFGLQTEQTLRPGAVAD